MIFLMGVLAFTWFWSWFIAACFWAFTHNTYEKHEQWGQKWSLRWFFIGLGAGLICFSWLMIDSFVFMSQIAGAGE